MLTFNIGKQMQGGVPNPFSGGHGIELHLPNLIITVHQVIYLCREFLLIAVRFFAEMLLLTDNLARFFP
jgi:hypothetical protein